MNNEALNNLLCTSSQRQPTKVIKNHKAYDRARDRKDKKLYEVEKDENSAVEEERPCVL